MTKETIVLSVRLPKSVFFDLVELKGETNSKTWLDFYRLVLEKRRYLSGEKVF